MHSPLLTALYGVAALAGGATAFVMWTRSEVRGGRALAAMIAAAAFWTLCDAFELQAQGVDAKRLVSQIQYLGVVSAGPFFFLAAYRLSGFHSAMRAWLLLAVWGIPLVTLFVAWTSAGHTWLWTDITIADPASNIAVYHYGAWFWVLTAQHYLLFAAGTVLLVRGARRVAPGFGKPLLAVIAAVSLPWLGNVMYVFKLGPLEGVNWLGLSLLLSGVLFSVLVLRRGLLSLLPQAREALLEVMSDAVVVLDRSGQPIVTNPAAMRMGLRAGDPLPAPVASISGSGSGGGTDRGGAGADRGGSAFDGGAVHEEVCLDLREGVRWLDVRSNALRDRWGRIAGRILVLRDVTDRKALEDQKEKLIGKLERALGAVRELEGMLPICAGCKNVRDDGGYWKQIEEYLETRSGVQFSHGFCPDCLTRLYGDEMAGEPVAGDPRG